MTRTAASRPTRSVYTPAMKRKPRHRLDPEGRVRIPRKLLEAAGLRPGDTVEIDASTGGVTVRPAEGQGLVREGGLLVHDGVPEEDLIAAERRMRREDDAALLRRCAGR